MIVSTYPPLLDGQGEQTHEQRTARRFVFDNKRYPIYILPRRSELGKHFLHEKGIAIFLALAVVVASFFILYLILLRI